MPSAIGPLPSRFSLTIDGQVAGQPKLVTGGDTIGDVVEDDLGNGTVRKRIAGLHYRDIDVTCGTDMAPVLRDWISGTLSRSYLRKSGSVGILDTDGAERVRLDFEDALLTEIAFPALDAASKEAAVLLLRISPERVRRGTGSGGAAAMAMRSKSWLVSNFRVDIPGLVTNRISRIEPLTVRLEAEADPIGEMRRSVKSPTRLVVPDLVVTLPEADVDTWARWHEDFVINGRNDASQERTGVVRLIGADLKTVGVELTLQGLGIVSLRSTPSTRSDQLATVQATMYCQQVAVSFPAA